MWEKHYIREFLHEHPKRKQYSPFPCAQKKYGKEAQMIEGGPESLSLSKVKQKFIQKVTGKLLYLRKVIGITLLTPLLAIASQQAAPTQRTTQHTKQLLDYIAPQ